MVILPKWFTTYYCIQNKGAECPLYAFQSKSEAEEYLNAFDWGERRKRLEIKRRRLSVEERVKGKWIIIAGREIEIPAERLEVLK